MMAKPMKTLELHYPMIQFLIMAYTRRIRLKGTCFSLQVYEKVEISKFEENEKEICNLVFYKSL